MSGDDALHFAADDIFQSIYSSFSTLGYNESNIRDRYTFRAYPEDAFPWPQLSSREVETASSLDVLVYLFMGQESIPIDWVVRSLGFRLFSEMQELRLIRLEEGGRTCLATVRIEPVDDLLICADLVPTQLPARPDLVYRPWDPSAQLYMQIIPKTNCENLLEMCCGTAYVCLTAARHYAQSTFGVDISPRAIQFAEFNKKLNAAENVRTYCGDLFRPIESSTFDRIVAHPPHIPALKDVMLFKDAGVDGERISADLIRSVPHHLADGGEFHSYLMLSDRVDAPAERRVRDFLGGCNPDFDVSLFILEEKSTNSPLLRRAGTDPFSEENQQLREACRKLGITKLLSTVLTIRSRRRSLPETLRYRAASWQTVAAVTGRHHS